ncbi:MAG: FtsX-like permease family protein [Woeseiaceae bacterium]|jgi:putative ABC transport system permease protein|nr:FtsX-like permease family protein [Woeseiaceae bacterium]
MPVILKASLGFLWRHPWQLFLATLGVCIGVAVIVAVDLANASSRIAFLQSLESITGDATHQVVGGPAGIDESLYVDLRRNRGIDSIAPVVESDALIGERSFTLLGADLFAEQALRDYEFATAEADVDANGRSVFTAFLVTPGSVVMSEQTAADLGLDVGSGFELTVSGRRQAATLVGTFADGGTLAGYILADIATAQEWLDQPGRLTRIDVRLDEDEVAAFRAALPDDVRLLDAEGRTRSTLEMSDAFMVNLNAMSLLALLVGLFLIYNSASFSVLQRRPLLGILRALGVTRGQAFVLIIGEAAVLGLVAGALGVLLGIWLGERLLFFVTQSINDLYFRVAVTSVTISQFTLVKGLAAGFIASIVAAAVPAIEAAASPPRLAMARSALEKETGVAVPRIAVAGIAVLALAFLTLVLSETSLIAGLVAVFLLILGFAMTIPWIVLRLTRVLAPLARFAGGVPARLAVVDIGTSLSRTGVAIVALAVAVSATIGVSVMVDSFRGSVQAWLERTLSADIYFGLPGGGLDAGLVDAATALPGVSAYSTTRRALLPAADSSTRVIAIRMAPDGYAGIDILDADPDSVWPAWEAGNAVLVSEPYAYRNRVGPGDTLTLPTDRGPVDFDVLASFQSYDVNGSGVMMSRRTYDRLWDDSRVDSIGLYLADGASVAGVVADVEALGGRYEQDVFVSSNADIRDLSLSIFDRTFIVTNILYWLAVGVAIVGILGSMLALQLERGRELGLLRALGMTPGQLGGHIAFQTGTIGAISGIAAIPLGIAMAWVLIDVINRRAFGWQIAMDVTPGFVIAGLGLAIGSALVAGAYPAWRAARTQPALAMREE